MTNIDKHFYLIELFDLYKGLLTNKQCDYFKASYFLDKTLSEIADENNVSRTAVCNAIKNIELELNNYEKILNLYKKRENRLKLYNLISDLDIKNKLISMEENE
ncbi:MAG: DNA-binding protein, partial [Ureaplasma sp.]|nr:DNA-binding protein [Ureaplasma sp.]